MISAAPFSMEFNDAITLATVDSPLGPMVILCKPQRSNGPRPLGFGEGNIVCCLQDSLDSEVVEFVKYAMKKEIRNTRLNTKGREGKIKALELYSPVAKCSCWGRPPYPPHPPTPCIPAPSPSWRLS